jgi:hypothetical protein
MNPPDPRKGEPKIVAEHFPRRQNVLLENEEAAGDKLGSGSLKSFAVKTTGCVLVKFREHRPVFLL